MQKKKKMINGILVDVNVPESLIKKPKRKDIEQGECPICKKLSPLRMQRGKLKIFACKKCRPVWCG